MEPRAADIIRRRALIDHIDWEIRPRAWFYGQLDEAIDLAVAGRGDELTELDCRRCRVSEVIDGWNLAPFVERVRSGEFEEAGREEEQRNKEAREAWFGPEAW